jgi:hypothetical protein
MENTVPVLAEKQKSKPKIGGNYGWENLGSIDLDDCSAYFFRLWRG